MTQTQLFTIVSKFLNVSKLPPQKRPFEISILSGDNEGEKESLKALLPAGSHILFNQKPEDKLHYIKSKQELGKKVMMLGDGLNDAGALAQSNVGIAISENINVFSPACDGILDAKNFELFIMKKIYYLSSCNTCMRIIDELKI